MDNTPLRTNLKFKKTQTSLIDTLEVKSVRENKNEKESMWEELSKSRFRLKLNKKLKKKKVMNHILNKEGNEYM